MLVGLPGWGRHWVCRLGLQPLATTSARHTTKREVAHVGEGELRSWYRPLDFEGRHIGRTPTVAAKLSDIPQGRQARAWGWTLLEVSAERVSAAEQPEDGYRITVAAVPGQHRVTVDVAAPCTRTVRGPADSVFG
jgi:hypothetical protein